MKTEKFRVSSNGFRFGSALAFCLASVLAGAVVASAQKEDEKEKRVVVQHGSSIEIFSYTHIPEATEACSPGAFEWWQRVRRIW